MVTHQPCHGVASLGGGDGEGLGQGGTALMACPVRPQAPNPGLSLAHIQEGRVLSDAGGEEKEKARPLGGGGGLSTTGNHAIAQNLKRHRHLEIKHRRSHWLVLTLIKPLKLGMPGNIWAMITDER